MHDDDAEMMRINGDAYPYDTHAVSAALRIAESIESLARKPCLFGNEDGCSADDTDPRYPDNSGSCAPCAVRAGLRMARAWFERGASQPVRLEPRPKAPPAPVERKPEPEPELTPAEKREMKRKIRKLVRDVASRFRTRAEGRQ